jgi:hypothetical protein
MAVMLFIPGLVPKVVGYDSRSRVTDVVVDHFADKEQCG